MPPKKESVAIVGAGPAGLIAARKLLALTPFTFTIFEKADRVGGLWDRESFIHPEMMTNFCRFTASFSDFAWESVDLGRPAPVYPQAWMVEKYLQGYAEGIPEACFEFGTRVTGAEREGEGWEIRSEKNGVEEVRLFDYLIVATGYLQHPKELRCKIDAEIRTDPLFPVPILHSTQYRSLAQLIPLEENAPRTVLVVGGSHSGADIAALIAHQASDARWGPKGNEAFGGVRVVHVGMNVLLPIPGMVWDKTAPHVSMHPLEFTLCERATREPEPLTFRFAPASVQENQVLLYYYDDVIEGGAGGMDFTEELPANVALGDRYYQCMQDDRITLIPGSVMRLEKGKANKSESKFGTSTITAHIRSKDGTDIVIDDIAAVVNATGFDSSGSLSFLSPTVKENLGFDARASRLPAVLPASYMSQNAAEPSLALLGFVPVNWGILEMQMRAVVARWTGCPFTEDPAHIAALQTHMQNLQSALRDPSRKSEVPQFLFGDYLGLLEQASRELGMTQIGGSPAFSGFFCAARFVLAGESPLEAEKTMAAVQRLRDAIVERNLLLAYVAFTGLSGRWISTGYGVAAHPRYPTTSGYDLEYLVIIYKNETVGAGETEVVRLVARYTEVTYEISLWEVDGVRGLQTGQLICGIPINRDSKGEVTTSVGSFAYHVDFRGSRLSGFRVTRRGSGGSDETFVFRRPWEQGLTEILDGKTDGELSADGNLGVPSGENGVPDGSVVPSAP